METQTSSDADLKEPHMLSTTIVPGVNASAIDDSLLMRLPLPPMSDPQYETVTDMMDVLSELIGIYHSDLPVSPEAIYGLSDALARIGDVARIESWASTFAHELPEGILHRVDVILGQL